MSTHSDMPHQYPALWLISEFAAWTISLVSTGHAVAVAVCKRLGLSWILAKYAPDASVVLTILSIVFMATKLFLLFRDQVRKPGRGGNDTIE